MSARFWVGGTATWDATAGLKWSTTSGGAGGSAVPTSSDDVTFDANSGNNVVTISGSRSCKSFTAQNFPGSFSATGSTLTATNCLTFNGGGKTFDNVVITMASGNNLSFGGTNTFNNLTISGNSFNEAAVTFSANQIISTLLTVNGASAILRIRLKSGLVAPGQITLNAASTSMSNVNLSGIIGAGAATWNLSAITGNSGDMGNNTGITFTTSATQYWYRNTGNWNDPTKWFLATNGGGGAGRVPLPQDDVVFDGNSFNAGAQTVTLGNFGYTGRDLNWTGVTNTPTWSTASSYSIFGGFTLVAGMTLSGTPNTITLGGFNTSTFTSAGQTIACTFLLLDGYTGSFTLADAFVTNGTFQMNAGTFNAVTFNLTAKAVTRSGTQSLTINLGTGTWTLTGTGTVWSPTTATVNAGTSTIKITDASASSKTFAGASNAYYNLWLTGAGSGTYTITGSNNSYNDFKDNNSVAHSLLFANGSTNSMVTWTVNGSAGNVITINSVSGTFSLVALGTRIDSDYVSIAHCAASPAWIWYAGRNCTDAGNNTGWIFHWTNPGNVYLSDNVYATFPATTASFYMQISKDAGASWSPPLSVTFGAGDTTQTFGAGITELWGESFTGADIVDALLYIRVYSDYYSEVYTTFGFAIAGTAILTGLKAEAEGKWNGSTMSIDRIRLEPHYGTSSIPISQGSQAYATNGRKPGEGAGTGTGVPVFFDSTGAWRSFVDGATVAA